MRTGMCNPQKPGGIRIRARNARDIAAARLRFIDRARQLRIDTCLDTIEEPDGSSIIFRLQPELLHAWTPDFDTLELCGRLHLNSHTSNTDLEKEILLTMLAGPVAFEYPTYPELAASVRIRQNIVNASRRTALSFHTSKIERPLDYWTYSEQTGFTVLPGKPLIEALRKATQPEVSGELYAFSCYRATEYVILLGLAQELASSNPPLLDQLQRQWENRAIMSRQFHDVFTREFGSMSEPLPEKYYVPGDRLWFRNPDPRSADITGYEGSWVIYLGAGLFTNFWDPASPYSIHSKCVEIYHWRNGANLDADGNMQMDEAAVAEHVCATMRDADKTKEIIERMMKLRDPQDVYADGGCIDASREYPRWVCPDSTDLVLPAE